MKYKPEEIGKLIRAERKKITCRKKNWEKNLK